MIDYRKNSIFTVRARRAYINITPQVEAALAESNIKKEALS
jgi:thiamine phosphate synthase YjbQ (UPF0047 family)